MIILSDHDLDVLLQEDIPYLDLTTWAVTEHDPSLRNRTMSITYHSRESGVACGTEEVGRMLVRQGGRIISTRSSGELITAGDDLVTAEGPAEGIFAVWKVGQNILDSSSGIATETRKWKEKIQQVGSSCPLFITRKIFPGTKKLATKACLAGGALPHRLGVSETILIFAQHLELMGGVEALCAELPDIVAINSEKKVFVEVATREDAHKVLAAGASGIQFDKVPAPLLAQWTTDLRAEFPGSTFIAAGGINAANVADYATTGVDGLVTSALYSAKPLDIGVRITRA